MFLICLRRLDVCVGCLDVCDAGFVHSAPLDASGNALGPFEVDHVVKVLTEVSNSGGTRSTAPRTITLQTPIL